MSNKQERWQIVVDTGTKATVRRALGPGESLSGFVRAAIEAELDRRQAETMAMLKAAVR